MAPVASANLSSRASTLAGARLAPCVRAQPAARRATAFMVEAKGKSRMRRGGVGPQQMAKPPTPPVDPDNEEFVVFVRATKLPRWIPFTIVKGGPQANVLVKAMNGNFGKEFYSKTLINNIGQAIYKEKDIIINSIRNGMPGYKDFKEFEFGFKIRNKDKPEAWYQPEELVILPAEQEMPKGPLENLKSSIGAAFGKKD